MQRIIDLDHDKARAFLLKKESYCNFDLPAYFDFQGLLDLISQTINGHLIDEFYKTYDRNKKKVGTLIPSKIENVNYKLINNKDGKYSWRPFQLIHPTIYVALVHQITIPTNWKVITERFKLFQSNSKIDCYSLPLESENELSDKASSITNWWQNIEQKSIELALKYEYVIHTDIADCYGSIYTHSIPWAIHTKTISKTNRGDNLIGNLIDRYIREMSFGQTNGIPQGSTLMDFIAEIILGYADLKLSQKATEQQIDDYHIIRYRDDYRIFSNNPQCAEHITKLLSEVLIDLGMRLNSSKTFISNNIITDSIKPDKLYLISSIRSASSLQSHLLLIHQLAQKYPNSGSVNKSLTKYLNRLHKAKETKENILPIVSILMDITYKNSKTYAISSAILSKLLSMIESEVIKEQTLNDILIKFSKLPNTGLLEIWLQRLTIKPNRGKLYNEKLCQKVNDLNIQLWDSSWLNQNMNNIISSKSIINEVVITNLDTIINKKEVELFGPYKE